jgi:hypothetical protein
MDAEFVRHLPCEACGERAAAAEARADAALAAERDVRGELAAAPAEKARIEAEARELFRRRT